MIHQLQNLVFGEIQHLIPQKTTNKTKQNMSDKLYNAAVQWESLFLPN